MFKIIKKKLQTFSAFCTFAERLINIKTLLNVPQKATALMFM